MALDLPKHKELFKQRDVRETPVPSTTPTYLTISDESGTIVNSRQLAVNTDDLDLSDAGAGSTATISLKNKTSYWSGSPYDLMTSEENINYTIDTSFSNIGFWTVGDANWNKVFCPVHLPQGAVVTGALVSGTTGGGTLTWSLVRLANVGAATPTTMATATTDTEDTTISNATIDNDSYSYYFKFATSSPVEVTVEGLEITYTTDYD